MTELIVALDCPDSEGIIRALADLHNESGIKWFKINHISLMSIDMIRFMAVAHTVSPDLKIFADLKLADPQFTCKYVAEALSESGVDSVSTFTNEATRAMREALDDLDDSSLKIWQVVCLTDHQDLGRISRRIDDAFASGADGVISPGTEITFTHMKKFPEKQLIIPGVRRFMYDNLEDGHTFISSPNHCKTNNADYAVVGRPILLSADPIQTARKFQELLA